MDDKLKKNEERKTIPLDLPVYGMDDKLEMIKDLKKSQDGNWDKWVWYNEHTLGTETIGLWEYPFDFDGDIVAIRVIFEVLKDGQVFVYAVGLPDEWSNSGCCLSIWDQKNLDYNASCKWPDGDILQVDVSKLDKGIVFKDKTTAFFKGILSFKNPYISFILVNNDNSSGHGSIHLDFAISSEDMISALWNTSFEERVSI